jgi:hypothetical protein
MNPTGCVYDFPTSWPTSAFGEQAADEGIWEVRGQKTLCAFARDELGGL